MKFKSNLCNGEIKEINRNDLKIKGHIEDFVKDKKIYYIAAAPADYRSSFTGSGLPFYNQIQAFENTPNIGEIHLDEHNSFEIDLMTPNSYMVGLGSVTILPTLYIEYLNKNDISKVITIKVSNGIPYRSLTYPLQPRPRTGPEFYDSQFYLPVRSQEKILMNAGYPKRNIMSNNFWSLKPPL